MGDYLIMSGKERKRKVILEEVKKGMLTLKDAAPKLEVGYRQAKRIWKKYLTKGDVGLIHANRGKSSANAYSQGFKDKILNLYRNKYMGFGPTFAAEKIEEQDDVKVNAETLRLWLLGAHLLLRSRKRKSYRQRRERKECFGELLQIDGSDHAWFGKDKGRCCLLNIVDDATGITLSQLDRGETCQVLLRTFKMWVEKYGVPQAVYVDLKSLYVSERNRIDNNLDITMHVFERVCYLLNVKVIKAYSAQGKGRVERNHGVYQDRFVKELQLRSITTIGEANDFLTNEYLAKTNKKFAKQPKSSRNAHCPAKAYGDLNQIFCWEYRRKIQNDFTIRFNNRFFQIGKQQSTRTRVKQEVIVHVHLNGDMSLWNQEQRLSYKEVSAPVKAIKLKKGINLMQCSKNGRENKHKTPWSIYNPGWLRSEGVVHHG
jgi:hypothetical protein